MSAFLNAIAIDRRHYNGWYGVGMIYYKQENYQLALHYYQRALTIAQHNPILMCHLAIVMHQLKQTEVALKILSEAARLDPKNALVKFHLASIRFACEDYDSALAELNELRQI